MLARRLLYLRRTTILSNGPDLPIFMPSHIPVGVGPRHRGRTESSRVDDSMSFLNVGGQGGATGGPYGSFPYLSEDELGWSHSFSVMVPPSPFPRHYVVHYKQKPVQLVSQPSAEDVHDSVIAYGPSTSSPSSPNNQCVTMLRDCIMTYLRNSSTISRMDWDGLAMSDLDLSPHGLITGPNGLWTSSGRYAVDFRAGQAARGKNFGLQLRNNANYANPAINPELRAPNPIYAQLLRFAEGDTIGNYTFPADDYEFGFAVDGVGTIKKFSFNQHLFSLPIPAGAENAPVWFGCRQVVELDRCQAVDGIYILAQIFAQDVRSDGNIQQVFFDGTRYLRRVKASYSSRYVVAILKIVEDQLEFHHILCDGSGTFPYGDYAWHQTHRSNVPWWRGIEWTRPPGSEHIVDNPSGGPSQAAGQISAAEYLQHFDHISSPPDPLKPWIIGFPSNVVDKIPEVSTHLFTTFNFPSGVSETAAESRLRMAFDGEYFYLARQAPLYFQDNQPVYKLNNLTGGISILQTAWFSDVPISRIHAFPNEDILYVESLYTRLVNGSITWASLEYQVDTNTGQRLPLKAVTSPNQSQLVTALGYDSLNLRLMPISRPKTPPPSA